MGPIVCSDDAHHHRRRDPHPPLFHRVHARRSPLWTLFRRVELLRRVNADPGAGRQFRAPVCGMGAGGTELLPAHIFLVSETRSRRRRQESLHCQPGRGLRLPDRLDADPEQLPHADLRHGVAEPGPLDHLRHGYSHHSAPAARGGGKVCPDSSLLLAA